METMMRQMFVKIQRILSLSLMLFVCSSMLNAQTNLLKVESDTVHRNSDVTISVLLDNESEISGGQFVVEVPSGFVMKSISMSEGRRNGHTLDYRFNSDSTNAMVMFYAQPTALLKGNSGSIVNIEVGVPEVIAAGVYPVVLSEIKLAADAVVAATATAENGYLTVPELYEISVPVTDGGSVTGNGIYEANAIVELTAFPGEGFHFEKWSDGSTDNPYSFVASESLTIIASFQPNKYTLEYVVDDVVISSEEVSYGEDIDLLAEPTKEGYTFSGWSDAPATMPANDIVVTGSFSINSYTMTYMVDGEEYHSETVLFGSGITQLESPTKEGYTFSGWGEVPATMPAENVTIEGSFAVNSYKLTYMVDGEEFYSETVEYGTELTAIDAPVSDGVTFSGWVGLPKTMPAKDVVVTGSFSTNSYTITYIVDGEVYHSELVEYGSELTALAEPTKEGYTFSGWSEVPATMPAENVTIEGSFTINSYTLTYMVDGEEFYSETVEYGLELTAIDAPVSDGLTFSGWIGLPKIMPAKDVVVTGSFSVNSYIVTYIVDGEVYYSELVEFGKELTVYTEPTKEGYTFSGWSEAPETMPAENVIIEGSFTINSYTLTYMVDGEEYYSEELEFGEELTVLTEPTKKGYTFSGWSAIPETMPAEDVIIEGSFTVNSYRLTYMVDGEEYHSELVEYGTELIAIDAPTRDGYTFSGWVGLPKTMPAKDVTVTGSYSTNSYTLTYLVDGEEYYSETIEFGEEIMVLAEPTKKGYTFSGWSEVPVTMPAEDVIIEGSFIINSYRLTYMVDGEEYYSETLEYGTELIAIDAPTRDGYTFSGWVGLPKTMPAKDVTVIGRFSANSYTLTYLVDGEEYYSETLEFGEEITAIVEPNMEGYTFSGWSEVPATMPAENVTIEGTFAINSYKLTYMVDGEEFYSETVEYGTKLTAIDAPVRKGYIFSGWSEVPATMPAEDVVITGNFVVDSVELLYDNGLVNVYSINGKLLLQKVTIDDAKRILERGLYIINGSKILIQ